MFVIIEIFKHFFQGHIQINNLNNSNNNWISFISNLFLLNSIKLPSVNDVSWNNPSWSISAEAIAYIVFGFIVLNLNKLKWIKFKNYAYCIIILIAGISLCLIKGGFIIDYTFDFGFLRGILGFFSGAICFNAFFYFKEKIQNISKIVFSYCEILLVILMVVFISLGSFLKNFGYFYDMFFFITIFVFAFEKGIISEFIKKPKILNRIGTYSYSIYMVHALCISLFNILFVRILKFQPSAYFYLVFLNYFMIYKVAQWTYNNIEMRFNYRKLS